MLKDHVTLLNLLNLQGFCHPFNFFRVYCLTIPWVPTIGFSRVRLEFSLLAEGRHIFGRRPKLRAAKPREKTRAGHYKDLTETGNRARKVSGTQGSLTIVKIGDTTNVLYKPRFHTDRSRDRF